MPKIFTVIDTKMKQHFVGKRTDEIALGMPKGIIQFSEKWVESAPIKVPGHQNTCFIKGKFDTVVKFHDETYGVIDFKTSETKAEHIPLYARQLHAYAYALENAGPRQLSLHPVSKLGLLVFEPEAFVASIDGRGSLHGKLNWIEIPRDDRTFLEFISSVLSILEQPSPPEALQTCEWCGYRHRNKELNATTTNRSISDLLKESIKLTNR